MRPGWLEQRANRYLPILTGLIRVAVYLAAIFLVNWLLIRARAHILV